MYSGACAIGIYFQYPSGGRTIGPENWDKVLWTTMVAIDLHVGTVRAGWSIDFPSGLQVCFFFNIYQSGNFDLHQSLEWNLDRSIFFQGRRDADLFPALIPMLEPEQWVSDLRDRLIREGYPPELAASVEEYTAMGVGSWGPRPIKADCEAAISHLGIDPWFIWRTGVTLAAPRFETDGHCTLGIYLMHPLDPVTGQSRPFARVQGAEIDIGYQANLLVEKVENQPQGGAYVNLPNGLELCLYDQSFVDPSNVCAKMTKMRLRDCLDNRVEANRRRTATTNARRTSVAAAAAAATATTVATAISPRILRGH
ncbi:hypothetical protein MMC27_000282 [Xylographa pallens]|nr:hypothetical protein [Xylographa pallens]